MRKDAIELERSRLGDINDLADYHIFKERHRVFPAIFEGRQHKKILDIASGVGCVAQRINGHYPAELVCSDISPICLRMLRKLGIPTVSFDIDDDERSFPFCDGRFDSVISLVTIEHLIHVEHFVQELYRILADEGYLYISTPNYAAPEYVASLLLTGRTFHNPLAEDSRYEFYAHVRYFTYKTLLELVSSFGFVRDTVYVAVPESSSRYLSLYAKSKPLALAFRYAMWLRHNMLPPRWASEPIVCFQKTEHRRDRRLRKVVL